MTKKADKIEFMRKVLGLHVGEQYTQTQFPTFYALDLVSFGINRKVPEAVRLGERILAEQDVRMPADLAKAVGLFMLDSGNS